MTVWFKLYLRLVCWVKRMEQFAAIPLEKAEKPAYSKRWKKKAETFLSIL